MHVVFYNSISAYMASDGRMIGELRIGNNLEGCGHGRIEALDQHLPEVTEKPRKTAFRITSIPARWPDNETRFIERTVSTK
jgi:hypothetical protein